jgi:hypothetical protein
MFNDQAYLDEETVTLKVPLVLPYRIDLGEYERVDGEIEYAGEFYRLVKQKLENDTLFIVCYKDQDSKRIKQVLADYVKTFTDKPLDAKQHAGFYSGFIKDFIPTRTTVEAMTSGWCLALCFGIIQEPDYHSLIAIASPPPKA